MLEALKRKPQAWVDFMMRFELGLEEPQRNRASRSAITIALSYVVGGLVPLAPYMAGPQFALGAHRLGGHHPGGAAGFWWGQRQIDRSGHGAQRGPDRGDRRLGRRRSLSFGPAAERPLKRSNKITVFNRGKKIRQHHEPLPVSK